MTPLPKRGFGPPLLRYVFHPPQVSVLCFSCTKIHDRADQKLFWRGPKIFGRARSLVRFAPPIRFAPPHITAQIIIAAKMITKTTFQKKKFWEKQFCNNFKSLASRKRCDLKTRKRCDFYSAAQKIAGDFSAISSAIFWRFFCDFCGKACDLVLCDLKTQRFFCDCDFLGR